jgi:hypothetical protein
MTDRQLSTRDLAARTDSDETDSSPETKSAAGDQDSGFEGAPSDASLTRDPAAAQLSDTQAASSPFDRGTANAGEQPDPGRADARIQNELSRDDHEPLFPMDQSERFTSRWRDIQTSFVDQPRDAVAEADALVADLMQRLAASFSQERERLEAQWDQGDNVSTEDLRVALTRYRSFFDRLLSA